MPGDDDPLGRRSRMPHPGVMPFTTKERELLRRELCRHFGQDPAIVKGLFLRTGAAKGAPVIRSRG